MTIEELKQIKKALGYTNERIAELSGVPLSTVQKIFAGVTKAPRFETLRAIEKAMGVSRPQPAPYEIGPEWECPVLREARSEYRATVEEQNRRLLAKRQGEYTVEDLLAMPDEWRGELIDGVLYDLAAPGTRHQLLAGLLYTEFLSFAREQGLSCQPMIAPFGVYLDKDNKTYVEPDVQVVCEPERFRARGLWGAPDLVVEVLSASTRRRDLLTKTQKYMAAGVRELWLVDPRTDRILVYLADDEEVVHLYTLDQEVPVAIWDGTLTICLGAIEEREAARTGLDIRGED